MTFNEARAENILFFGFIPAMTLFLLLMFIYDNFGFKCTLNDSFCVKYVFDELGQVAARIRLCNVFLMSLDRWLLVYY
jgi:hypothetical protein